MSRHTTSHSPSHSPSHRPSHRSRRRRTGRRSLVAALAGAALAAGALSGVLPLWLRASAAPAAPTAGAGDHRRAVTAVAVDDRVTGVRQQILALVNARRARHGCGPLTASAPLDQLAESYSAEMGTGGFFSHTDPAGHTPWDRARAVGIANLGGENIAMGQQSPRSVMTAWMNSPGHRANILNCGYHSLGVGVYYGDGTGNGGGPWWTQDFGY
jgi:uncharacterized protein YkwD